MKHFKIMNLIPISLILLVWFVFVKYVIGFEFRSFEGFGDLTGWEYTGFYLFENIFFNPFPQITLFSNSTFYPFGINNVFMSWGLERDYFYALFYSFFGTGPWLQIYFSISFLISSLGVFILTKNDFGLLKAFLAAIFVPFLNAYGINKYPGHYGISIIHWSQLSIICDFIILFRFYSGKNISIHIILLRILFTVLSFGQEFGYILGLSLSSLSITGFLFLVAFHYEKQKKIILKKIIWKLKEELQLKKFKSILLLIMITLSTFFLAPLVLSIIIDSQKNTASNFYSGGWHASFWRMFLPYFSFLNPSNHADWGIHFNDNIEGYGSRSPGWFLLICALIGLWQSRKRIQAYLPFIALFLIYQFYESNSFLTHYLFPWFKYARVSTRFSIVFSTLLTIFFLGINIPKWKPLKIKSKIIYITSLLSILAILIMELPGIYLGHANNNQLVTLTKQTHHFMKKISLLPEKAILNWPFSICAGTATGICPNTHTSSIWGLRKYHKKHVPGGAAARLSVKNGNMYKAIGLHQILEKQYKECLNDKELEQLKKFYNLGDFAGISLYTNFIPANCLDGLIKKFGEPYLETHISHLGKIIFIKKSIFDQKYKDETVLINYNKKSLIYNNIQLLKNIFKLDEAYIQEYLFTLLKNGKSNYLKINLGDEDFKIHPIKLEKIISNKYKIKKDHPILLISNKKLKNKTKKKYIKIVQEDDLYFYLVYTKNKHDDIYFDFINEKHQSIKKNIINKDIFHSNGLIYTHPTQQAAQLTYKNIEIKENTYLKLGLDLKNIENSASYSIKINNKKIFDTTLAKKIKIENILISLTKYKNKKVDIDFVVTPNINNNFCWAYWIKPSLISKS